MAKKNDIVAAGGGDLATDVPTPGAIVQGRDATASISRLVLFQGTAEEQEMYGSDFKRGDFIDTLERRSLGQTIRIIPVAGWMSWAKFVKGQKVPVYSVRSKADVPPEDLDWNGKEPPAATETVNLILIAEGEQFPMLFMFKRTGLKAYTKVIEPMEQRWGHSLYELSSTDDKNPEGKPYKRLTARVVSKTPESAAAVLAQLKAKIADVQSKAEKLAESESESQSDSIPI